VSTNTTFIKLPKFSVFTLLGISLIQDPADDTYLCKPLLSSTSVVVNPVSSLGSLFLCPSLPESGPSSSFLNLHALPACLSYSCSFYDPTFSNNCTAFVSSLSNSPELLTYTSTAVYQLLLLPIIPTDKGQGLFPPTFPKQTGQKLGRYPFSLTLPTAHIKPSTKTYYFISLTSQDGRLHFQQSRHHFGSEAMQCICSV
jgi:hypothetical protein